MLNCKMAGLKNIERPEKRWDFWQTTANSSAKSPSLTYLATQMAKDKKSVFMN